LTLDAEPASSEIATRPLTFFVGLGGTLLIFDLEARLAERALFRDPFLVLILGAIILLLRSIATFTGGARFALLRLTFF
jgi:hypothetical protein